MTGLRRAMAGMAHRAVLRAVRRWVPQNVCFSCCTAWTHGEIKWRHNGESLAEGRGPDNVCPECRRGPPPDDEDYDSWWDGHAYIYRGDNVIWPAEHFYRHNRDGTIVRLTEAQARREGRRGHRRRMWALKNDEAAERVRFAAWAKRCGL